MATTRASTKSRPLLIVESPSKAKTIEKYLKSQGFVVKASVGHVKDLPKSQLGVDLEHNFKPNYQTIPSKAKVISEIVKFAETAPVVYLAPDPDREGEAIAWHLAEELPKSKNRPVYRVLFNAITKDSVLEALKHPLSLDENKYNAQQARRVLDRLVGYKISPILWDKVKRGLSAGRVQSVAVRLVVDRERDVQKFKSEEYWSILFDFQHDGQTFQAKLFKVNQEDPQLGSRADVDQLLKALEASKFNITKIQTKERQRKPSAPFITSRLQQEAARKLGFSAKKTMMIAQSLYEGKDLGEFGQTGLVTYIRTDSVRTTPEAINEVRQYISTKFGSPYLPKDPVIYQTKKSAQDAHEAIRPTAMTLEPEAVKAFLEHDEYRLYELIWNRFLSSQMTPAVFDQTSVDFEATTPRPPFNHVQLRLTGSLLKFPGFTKVYTESLDDASKDEDKDQSIPQLQEGLTLAPLKIDPLQHFTQPPPRFSDASLIREMEERGIGRPSTYASILSTIQDKEYVEKRENRYYPSELGTVVTDLLVSAFPDILNVDFTASMEEKLDLIEEGKANWVKILKEFYTPFEEKLAEAKTRMKDVKRQEIPTEHKCEKCGSTLVIKWGKQGSFLACSNYPECKFTQDFSKDEKGKIVLTPKVYTDQKCEKCGQPMIVKKGKFGDFLACSDYPQCKNTKVITTGIQCPQCQKGELAQKVSRFKRIFFGCTAYPNCNYALWDKPISKTCPDCSWPILTEKVTKREGPHEKCPKCGYKNLITTIGAVDSK